MVKYRITIDIIFDATDKPTAQQAWDWLKARKEKFKQIDNTLDNFGIEKSTVTLHECHHDEIPPLPCVVKKKITLNSIEQDDTI